MTPNILIYLKNKYALDLSNPVITLPMDRFRGFCGLLSELQMETGAEVGTLKGWYAKWLLLKNRKLKLYCVDEFRAYDDYSIYRDQKMLDDFEKEAHDRLATLNAVFVKKSSMEAVKDFQDNSLDFVYIDANHHFDYVANDIREWHKKVKVGGIVSGHDYSTYMFDVKKAVDEWVGKQNIKPLFLIGNKTWFYVKQ